VTQPQTQLAKKPPTPFEAGLATIGGMIDRQKSALKKALPKHLDVDRFARIAITCIRRTPQLATCDPLSFIGAVMQCAQLGLEPESALGHVFLVPFKGKAQVIIGYKGMLTLSYRSGLVRDIDANPVFDGDEFDYELGLNRRLIHRPQDDDENEKPEKLIAAYAVLRFGSGGDTFKVIRRRAIDATRDAALAQITEDWKRAQAPWARFYVEQAVKTAIRRAWKFAPSSPLIQRAVGIDELADAGIDQALDEIIDMPIEEQLERQAGAPKADPLDALADEPEQQPADKPAATPPSAKKKTSAPAEPVTWNRRTVGDCGVCGERGFWRGDERGIRCDSHATEGE
jgi:recombination protein RecT